MRSPTRTGTVVCRTVRGSLACFLAAAALTSCGGDEETTSSESPPGVQSTEKLPPTTSTEPTTQPPAETKTTTSESSSGDCGSQGSYAVRVVSGKVPCERAKSTVAGYDPDGEKVQEVGAYTCEGGEAAVRPLVFTCVAGDNEITASEP